MILDSSAIVAVMQRESEGTRLFVTMRSAGRLRLSAATYLEASIVMAGRRGAAGTLEVDVFLAEIDASVLSVTTSQARLARDAFLRFGKGRHPAALDFGDCFSYALAKERDEPLLFVGGDFARTSVRAAV